MRGKTYRGCEKRVPPMFLEFWVESVSQGMRKFLAPGRRVEIAFPLVKEKFVG